MSQQKKLHIEIIIDTVRKEADYCEHKIIAHLRKDVGHNVIEKITIETEVWNKQQSYTNTLIEAIDKFYKDSVLFGK